MNDHDCFQLTTKQLIDNSLSFYRAVSEWLKTNKGPLKCLPAYISLNKYPSGKALVLDFGGTQLRTAVVSIFENKINSEPIPMMKLILPCNWRILEKWKLSSWKSANN